MEGFKWAVLILPGISFLGVFLLYVHFNNQVKDRATYREFVMIIALTAFLLNLAWELLHGPLYEGYQYDWSHIRMCLLASVTDMLTLLIMLFGFGLFYGTIFWTRKLSWEKVLLIIITGGTGTILLERWHIATGHWMYAEAMPMVPFVEVGLTPLLQFTILPIVIFIVGNVLLKNIYRIKKIE